MLDRIKQSPVLVRVAPFLIFLLLTWLQDKWGESGRYWVYLAKTVIGGALLYSLWDQIQELRPVFSWAAVIAGVGVFLFWIGLDGWYPSLDQLSQRYLCPALKSIGLESWCPKSQAASAPWNPHAHFGQHSLLAWFFVVVRITGSTLVVPPLEEVFYRSFLYRYISKPDFSSVPLGRFLPIPFLVSAVVFGFTHHEWLAGILCGFVYQGLVCWKNRLGDAIVAHAITNLLMGLWVCLSGAWKFW